MPHWPARLLFALLTAALGVGGWSRFHDGLARDRALPVPYQMLRGQAVSRSEYLRAAAALDAADPRNGNSAIVRAEAAMNAGPADSRRVGALEDALENDPASARGWTLLSRALMDANRPAAAAALSQALILAPYDFWVVKGRVQMAAPLWSEMDPDARARALEQVRLLWEEPLLRPQLRWVLSAPGGVGIVNRAFADRRDEMVEMNRWLAADRRQRARSQ